MNFILLSLLLLSFFGFFGCLMWLIVSFFKKAPKKFPIISLIASVVIFFTSAPMFAHQMDKITDPVTEDNTSENDLEITADDKYTYIDRLEYDTDKDGIANIKATTAKDAKVVLTPLSPYLEKKRTKADENGNFNFEVEVSDTDLEEYELQASYNDEISKKLDVHVWNDYYEDENGTEDTINEEENTSDPDNNDNDINSQIDDHLIEDKGFASGTLDENGNESDSGIPNPEFNWALTIDDIKYSDNFLTITVNDNFLDYNESDAQDALNRAQNAAYQFIGEDEDWSEEKYRDGIYTSVKYNNNQIAESKLTNPKEFKWKE